MPPSAWEANREVRVDYGRRRVARTHGEQGAGGADSARSLDASIHGVIPGSPAPSGRCPVELPGPRCATLAGGPHDLAVGLDSILLRGPFLDGSTGRRGGRRR